MIWALISDDGSVLIRHAPGHPAEHGDAEACEGRIVIELPREPEMAAFETVAANGSFILDIDRMLAEVIPQIKSKAGGEIEAVAPLWRQLNDLNEPETPGAILRRESIAKIRAESNRAEARLKTLTTVEEVRDFLHELYSKPFG